MDDNRWRGPFAQKLEAARMAAAVALKSSDEKGQWQAGGLLAEAHVVSGVRDGQTTGEEILFFFVDQLEFARSAGVIFTHEYLAQISSEELISDVIRQGQMMQE